MVRPACDGPPPAKFRRASRGAYALPVPRYDFECDACGAQFEALVAVSEVPVCPECGAPDPRRVYTPFSGPFTVGLRGAKARQSNAIREDREQRRRERFAKQREERRQRHDS